MNNLEKLAYEWATIESEKADTKSEFYCQTRDVFESRNDKTPERLIVQGIDEGLAYMIFSMLGELGNNSFDHNLANWPDIPGIFFSVVYDGKKGKAIIADRGLGVLKTLRKAKPELKDDQEALEIAFTKKISSRILENRGNGLKFVKNNIMKNNLVLEFYSGDAEARINHAMEIKKSKNYINGCIVVLNF